MNRTLELIYTLSNKALDDMKDETLCTSGQLRIYSALSELNRALDAVSITPASPIDIIDREECLEVKVWTREDVANQLKEEGYETSEEMIDAVIGTGYLKALGECDDSDWYVMREAIKEAVGDRPYNTEFFYMYRDADNYKTHQSVIVTGLITAEQEKIIESCLSDDEFFIPSQVGLPEVRCDDELTEADHCWFEFGYFEPTTKANNTDGLTVKELVFRFERAKGKWDDTVFAMEHPEIFEDDEDEEE